MNPIADYMTAETELPAYLPYPRFLLKMDISHTAKLLYALLLDRSKKRSCPLTCLTPVSC